MMTTEFVSPGPLSSSDHRVPSGSSPEADSNLNSSPEEDIDLDSLIKKPAVPLSHWAPTIKDFDIIKPISRGAFGKVFLAKKCSQSDGTVYAIKVMKKSELVQKNMVAQAIAERNAMALNRSPFCVNLFYCLQSTDNIFLVMEYLIGGDLKSLLGVYGFFEESMAKFYVAEIALALSYLHKHSIIHRDLKPDNILLTASGHIKLTDFGLSSVGIDRELQIADLISSTPKLRQMTNNRVPRTPGQILSLTTHLNFYQRTRLNSSAFHDSLSSSGTAMGTILSDGGATFNNHTALSACHTTRGASSLGNTPPGCDVARLIHNHNIRERTTSTSSTATTATTSTTASTHNIESPARFNVSVVAEEQKENVAISQVTPTLSKSSKRPRTVSNEKSSLTDEFTNFKIVKRQRSRINVDAKNCNTEETTPPSRHVATSLDVDSCDGIFQNSTPISSVKNRIVHFLTSPETPVNLVIHNKSFDGSREAFQYVTPDASKNVITPLRDPVITTPFRTPKSVKGKNMDKSDQRILGTPDYLAPELLLRHPHNEKVDWWSLGVCLYEFMTGIPPFMDESAELVFENILSGRMEWPEDDEALSCEAVEAITSLLTLDPSERPGFVELQQFPLFHDLDWSHLLEQEAPFVPQPDDETDTCYFEARNRLQQWQVSQIVDN